MKTQRSCLRRMPEMVNATGRSWELCLPTFGVMPNNISTYVLQADIKCGADSSTTSAHDTSQVSGSGLLLKSVHEYTYQGPTYPSDMSVHNAPFPALQGATTHDVDSAGCATINHSYEVGCPWGFHLLGVCYARELITPYMCLRESLNCCRACVRGALVGQSSGLSLIDSSSKRQTLQGADVVIDFSGQSKVYTLVITT